MKKSTLRTLIYSLTFCEAVHTAIRDKTNSAIRREQAILELDKINDALIDLRSFYNERKEEIV